MRAILSILSATLVGSLLLQFYLAIWHPSSFGRFAEFPVILLYAACIAVATFLLIVLPSFIWLRRTQRRVSWPAGFVTGLLLGFVVMLSFMALSHWPAPIAGLVAGSVAGAVGVSMYARLTPTSAACTGGKMKLLLLTLCCGIVSSSVFAQSDNRPRPDRFQEFILNETTSKDAIDSLGQPAADEVDRLEISKVGKWLDPKHKEKIFRHLIFKKVRDFRTIKLSFLDDKVMMIELEFGKHLKPEKLRDLFGIGFAIVGGPADLPDKPGQYPLPFSATHYPDPFTVVGISHSAFIWVNCSAFNGTPNRIDRTRQVSRALEKK